MAALSRHLLDQIAIPVFTYSCDLHVNAAAALYLFVNIDPGENAFPSREQELDTKTPEVADIFFWLAFCARKLGVVNKLNSQSFFDYITQGATHPDLFQELVVEPPERFYIAGRIEGPGCPPLFTLSQRNLYSGAVAKSRLDVVLLFWKKSLYSYRPKL